jgi:hypothetical protein
VEDYRVSAIAAALMSGETKEIERAEARLVFDDVSPLYHRLIFKLAFGITR